MAQESVELRSRSVVERPLHQEQNEDVPDSNPDQNPEFSLPPVDSGKAAWLFLAACWGVEAVTFGFGNSFGVFQNYFSTHPPFAGSGSIAAIGTTTTGILYLGAPFVVTICRLFPRQARWFTLLGLIIASIGLALSSLSSTVPHLIATQGVIFGIGGCMSYCPCNLYIDEWFVRRKGLAFGLVWSASGFGGAVLPLCLEALLQRVGFAKTAQICAGILFGVAAPLSFWIKPRLPYAASRRSRPLDMRFAKSRVFVLYQVANVVEATGYFLPAIYLPTYARVTWGASSFLAALTTILVNVAATVGLVAMGSLSDALPVTTCMLVSACGVGASVFLAWGLATSLSVLYVFCLLYGLFAGAWSAIWPGIMREMVAGNAGADPIMVQSHLCIGRGIGNVVSGPLSDALIGRGSWKGKGFAGYGSGFGLLIVYTGVTGLLSGVNFVLKKCKVL